MSKSRKKKPRKRKKQQQTQVPQPEVAEAIADVSDQADRASEPATVEPVAAASSRRRFFWQIWLALGGVALLEYLWLVVDFLNPRSLVEQVGTVIAGPVERFEMKSVTAFQRGEFYLSRLEDGGFLALSRVCTHLGCTVPWDDTEGRFICPCHSSEYDEKGVVLSPPAPRPLDLFPVRIENGVVKVDIVEPIKRTAFDESQVTPV